jgi:hypothetical protein
MTGTKIPYVTASGNVTKVLQKIQPAQTPERFTADFLATKLGMSGGSARPVIPFLKRIGFLGTDGVPMERYKRFRTAASRGAAAAEGVRQGYRALYEINEYAHDLNDKDLKDLVLRVTGSDEGSSTVTAILGSFKALAAFASFDDTTANAETEAETADQEEILDELGDDVRLPAGLSVGYTINLHLPATSDVAVFNAIFRSLRENLLR